MSPTVLQRPSAPLTALLLTALLALPSAADTGVAGVLAESIDVRVINVEAIVTATDGTRVPGLQPSDFRLLVDGEEVPIEYFTEVRGGGALAPPGGTSAAPEARPGERQGVSYLVFIDEFFTLDRDRRRVLSALTAELANLGPDDRMAIVAWDGSELEMLTSWTGSVSRLAEALGRAQERRAQGLSRLAERRQLELSSGSGRFLFARDPLVESEERLYAELLTDQTSAAVRGAAATLRGFGSPPGRRVMLLLSGGWPYSPTEFVLGPRIRTALDPRLAENAELFAPLTDAANLLGYTLYPIDVPGFQATSGLDARSRPLSTLDGGGLDFYREHELHAALSHLALETGGKALLNRERLLPLSTVVEDTRSYYWLGFTPRWEGNDSDHTIAVAVARSDVRVRTRRGFSDLSRQRQIAFSVESALLFGDPAAGVPLGLSVGRPEPSGWRRVEVPMTLSIPAGALAWIPSENGYMATLELYVAARDRTGATADVPVETVLLTRADLPGTEEAIPYLATLRLRRRPHDLFIAVHDAGGGTTLSAATRLSL